VANEVADKVDRSGLRKFNAFKFIFDHYQQFDLIEPVNSEIVTEVCFIDNSAHVDFEIISNERAQSAGTKISYAHLFPTGVVLTSQHLA
jgi:hypothetical protein